MQDDEEMPPFWDRLDWFFLLPLQKQPLRQLLRVTLVVLALCALSHLALGEAMVSKQFQLPLSLLLLATLTLILGRYGFKIILMTTQNRWRTQSFPADADMEDPEWIKLPRKLLALFVLQWGLVFALGLLFIPQSIVLLFCNCMLPACIMILAQDNNLREALNVERLFETISRIGPEYMFLCAVLILLGNGLPELMGALMGVFSALPGPLTNTILWTATAFLFGYLFWVFCAMTGYVMCKHREALDIDAVLVLDEEAEAGAGRPKIDPAQKWHHELALGRRARQQTPEDLLLHQHHLRLLLDGPPIPMPALRQERANEILAQGQHVIDLLLRQASPQQTRAALEAWKACRKAHKDFALNHAAHSLSLAHAAWEEKPLDARLVLGLLHKFEQRFDGDHQHIPRAWNLAARAWAQEVDQQDKALRLLAALKQHYPGHTATRQLEALLKPVRWKGSEVDRWQ